MTEDTSAAIWAPVEQRKGQRRLSHNLSVYLDLLRLLAAMAVFLGHAGAYITPWLPSFLTSQARNAVAVFFVLSGFVISFVVNEKEHSWRAYLTARASRIYSVAVLALLITFVCDTIGTFYNPNRYFELGFYAGNWMALFNNVTFLNELWLQHSVFGTSGPYWSLGFEVWYYIFFGLVYFLPDKCKLPAVVLWILVCGPKIALYLPLWLMGVMVYNSTMREYLIVRKSFAVTLMIFSIVLYLSTKKLFPWKIVADMYEWHSYKIEIISFIYYMLICFSVSINIISFDILVGDRKLWNRGFERWIRWLAGASFTLYLVHLPILILISTLIQNIKTLPFLGIASLVFTLLVTLLLAELGERRKKTYAHVISWVLGSRAPSN